MEEDIKHLEKRIDLNRQMYLEFGMLLSLDKETVNAIENLINKNKKLEKDVKQHKKYIKRMVRLEQLNYKIIKLMAKDIAENKLDEDICRKVKDPAKEDC